VAKLVAKGLAPDTRQTELRNMACPKCQRPIAVAVPVQASPPQAPAPAPKAAQMAVESQETAKAIDALVGALAKLKVALP
jgi:hypothetical protein